MKDEYCLLITKSSSVINNTILFDFLWILCKNSVKFPIIPCCRFDIAYLNLEKSCPVGTAVDYCDVPRFRCPCRHCAVPDGVSCRCLCRRNWPPLPQLVTPPIWGRARLASEAAPRPAVASKPAPRPKTEHPAAVQDPSNFVRCFLCHRYCPSSSPRPRRPCRPATGSVTPNFAILQ